MIGLGTILNCLGIVAGTAIGTVFGGVFSENMQKTIKSAEGIFVALLGVDYFLKTQNSLIPLIGLVTGIIIGELLDIEGALERFGGWLQEKTVRKFGNGTGDRTKFINGFVTASLLYCIGPMGIMGSIQDGMRLGIQVLSVKSLLDGVTSVVFATGMGIGVGFSIIPLGIYQGAITLLATFADRILSDSMITEMTATGGVLLAAIGISSLLEIKKIRVSAMLPALITTPLICWIVSLF